MTVKMQHGKTVGETNGRYALLFKLNQILIPVLTASLIGFAVWVVKEIQSLKEFRAIGPRYTREMAEKDLMEIKLEFEKRVSALAPQIFAARVDRLEMKVDSMAKDVTDIKLLVEKHIISDRP